MNVSNFINLGGDYVKNPNYKKGNGQPEYIRSVDAPTSNIGSTLLSAGATYPTVFNPDEESDRLARGMIAEKLPLRKDDYENNNFAKILSDSQSWLTQAKNSLVQTISEGTLGTVKAFADLFDLITLRELWGDTGYQNPVSAQIEAWQKHIRDNMVPIYQDPDVSVLNGGLIDSGFIFGGLPSIISSLTLLIPSKAVSYTLGKGASYITKQGIRMMRNAEKANRANQLGDAAELAADAAAKTSMSAKLNAFVEGNRGRRVKNILDYAVSGLTSRLLENYQESRQTYDDSKPVMLSILANMDDDEKNTVIKGLIDKFGADAADWNNDESIANLVSQKAADVTFSDDLWNVFSDIYQMYTIGSIGRVINGPSRAALRRLNRQNINTIGMDEKAVEKLLNSRTKLQKFRDKASDIAFGAKHTILSELAEGIEEAVNYIAQEEGFNYGKILLNQEAESDFWSDRFVDYLKAPKLWDSAFWGLTGGIVFNAGAEYGNRFINAINTIQEAKKAAKTQVNNPESPIHIPTFREAFESTELTVRKANLEQNVSKFNDIRKKLEDINNEKDVYGITADGKLKTEEEKAIARQRALLEFRDDVLLDAMDVGNYDLAKEYLSSEQLKQFFVDNNIMSREEADRTQREILTQGDELKREYDRQLRLIYNAVSDWGEQNWADLSSIPGEVFGIIARENIKTQLENKYYQRQIDRLNRANSVLEEDSKDELRKAAEENGVSDFKSIIQQIGRAQQLGMIRAEINDLKNKKQHLTVSGQASLKYYENLEKMLIDEIVKNSTVSSTGLNGEVIVNDAATAANLLLSAQAVRSVELLPFERNRQHTYQVNEGNENFRKLVDAVDRRDRKLIKELLPAISSILDSNPSREADTDTFLNEVVGIVNSKNEIIKNIHDNEGRIKFLQDINPQLEANYREIAALELYQLSNSRKINTTKEQIQRRANNIINEINQGRAAALESASILYQQLAKKYGKDELKEELQTFVLRNTHSPLYYRFTQEERSAYDYMTALSKFRRAEQDIVLKDIYEALEYNDIYEYSEDKDAVKIINESIKAAKEKSSASQNQNQSTQNKGINNQSPNASEQSSGAENRQIDDIVPISEDEESEGVVEVNNPNTAETTNEEEGQQDSSTGEVTESDIFNALDAQIRALEESNTEGITKDVLKAQTKAALKPVLKNIDDDTLDQLVDASINSLEEYYEEDGESIESKLAKGIVRLSTISSSNNEESVIKEANKILDRTFSKLLDHFNKHLSNGVVNGKYIIPLESLLRYAKHITNNEVEAQEMYNAFIKIIAEHPEKYTTIKGRVITETKLISDVNTSIETFKSNLEKGISGRTLNIKGLLASIDDNDKLSDNEKKELKKKVIETVKSLRPGDKLYVRANYDNAKEKSYSPGEYFVGGIDFIVLDAEGHETLIAKAPTPMYPKDGNKDRYIAELEGWHYEIPLAKEINKVEYPIQTFFKKLFTSDTKEARDFIKSLIEYETLTAEEAFSEEGNKLLDDTYKKLEEFASKEGINLNTFTQDRKKNTEGNRERIRHLAKLHIYTRDNWNIYAEEINYEVTEEELDLEKESYRESIDRWFTKMVESNNARRIITDTVDGHSTELLDVGVQIESVGKPVLVKTKAENALPATQAIAEQHKDNIHLAAGSRTNGSQLVVSNGKELSMAGEATRGRSVVVIDTPDGNRETINAYPIRFNNKIFEDNVKLAAFKEAIETKLFELLDEWFLRPNSENLQAFLDSLGHKSSETSKLGGSLFAGFFRSILPNGNGFSIKYKVDAEGKVISPTSKEEGEVHFLTFYDTVPLKHSKTGKTSKARAAVQDYVEGRENNRTVIWNTNPNDSSTLKDLEAMKAIIKNVLIDSLQIRIDPINILADNNSSMSYGSLLSRDAGGNLVLKVPGVKKPGSKAKQYAQENGDIIIPNVGRDGKAGNFSDFIIFNDIVNLTTKPISGSNFTVFDNSEGDFGIQYMVGESSPVERIVVEPVAEPLRKVIDDIINNSRKNTNISKAIVKAILNRIATANSSLYNLTKNSKILNLLLHKNVIFVDGFNGATIRYSNGATDTISDDAFAAYIPDDVEIGTSSRVIKVSKGTIIVGNKFMNLLDGNLLDITDALHHILHENVHAFIADNDDVNSKLNSEYKKDLEDIWEEYSRKHPSSPHANTNPNIDLEEFIVESLTNINLIKELNETVADNPLSNPKKPKSLLGKLLDKLISWLSDLLVGPNGEKFNIDKDSLLAKEYAIFEENIVKIGNSNPVVDLKQDVDADIEETDTTIEGDDSIIDFEIKIPTQNSSTGELDINFEEDEDDVPPPPTGIKNSTIAITFPTLRGALDNVSSDTYFDIKEKINNGVLSIKCN